MGKKVKCIDDGGFAHGKLIAGKIYELRVDRNQDGGDYWLVEVAGSFLKCRFVEVVDDAIHTKPTPKVFPAIDDVKPEWKLWAETGKNPQHCSCRINKVDCEYHK